MNTREPIRYTCICEPKTRKLTLAEISEANYLCSIIRISHFKRFTIKYPPL